MVRATERLTNEKRADGEDPGGHDLDPADAVDCRGACGQHRARPGPDRPARPFASWPPERGTGAASRSASSPRPRTAPGPPAARTPTEDAGVGQRSCVTVHATASAMSVRSPQRAAQEGRTRSRDAVCVANLVIGGPSDQRTVLLMPDPSRQPLVANDNAHARPPPSLDVLVAPVQRITRLAPGRRRGESHCSSWSPLCGTPTESDRIGDLRRRKHLPPTCFMSFS